MSHLARSTNGSRQPSKKGAKASAEIVDIHPSAPAPLDMTRLSREVWDMARIQDFMVKTINDILSLRRVPRDQTTSPGMDITVPAIEAMRYSPLRREIAALIATTMDARKRDTAHPSFLNILGQLTRDEIRLLDTMPEKDRLLPIANLYVDVGRGRTEVLYRNIIPEPLSQVCEGKSRVPQYIDNLRRLQLIEEPKEFVMPDGKIYSQIVKQPFCKAIVEARGQKHKTRIERRVICLSDFGAAFRDVCIA